MFSPSVPQCNCLQYDKEHHVLLKPCTISGCQAALVPPLDLYSTTVPESVVFSKARDISCDLGAACTSTGSLPGLSLTSTTTASRSSSTADRLVEVSPRGHPPTIVAAVNCLARPDFIKATGREVGLVNEFLASHRGYIKAQFSALEQRWGIRIGHPTPNNYHGVSETELQDLKATLLEIADNIARVETYFRVNQNAMARIIDKAVVKYAWPDVASDIAEFKHPPQGRSALFEFNETLKYVQKALQKAAEANRGGPSRSLLLEQSGFGRCSDWFRNGILSCLHSDDAGRLYQLLTFNERLQQPAVISLVHVAIVYGSSSCQTTLLKSLQIGHAMSSSLSHTDCLQQIIQHLNRADPPLDNSSAATSFGQILGLLFPHTTQLHLLNSRDRLGRLPLHYAALYGFDGVCHEIMSVTRDSLGASQLGKLSFTPDKLNLTPLDYAVQRGYAAVAELLLEVHETPYCHGRPRSTDTTDLLNTAIASRYLDVARLLIKKGWGLRYVSRSGRTILHTVAEQGLTEVVKDIVALGVDVDVQESVKGWTALTTASVQGHLAVVEALLESGARAEIPDYRGWLAKDYAAYRGNMRVADAIKSEGSSKLQPKPTRTRHLGVVNILPDRSPSESVIFIHLGTLDLYKRDTSPVDMTPYKRHISPRQVHDSSLELSISLAGSDQNRTTPLSFLSENSDRPWCFTSRDPENAAVMLKVSNLADNLKTSIGTGIALIGSLTVSLGSKRDTLIRDYNIPLVSDKYGHVGSVNITVVTARPYKGAHPPPRISQTLALEKSSRLGGHRGMFKYS